MASPMAITQQHYHVSLLYKPQGSPHLGGLGTADPTSISRVFVECIVSLQIPLSPMGAALAPYLYS